jgi:exopolyphosphatase/guanosine-5'-triphosphate,3'-diphosphate pyrophosphatase
VAAVDIGTNTTRLLVAEYREADLFEGTRLEWCDRRVTITRLGQGVDATGELSEEAMGRTVAVLAGYGEAIRAWEVDAVRVIATSATRDAANRDVFLRRATLALGVTPEVVTGAEEAELSFRGATMGQPSDVPVLVVDVGGGSTEFVQGTGELEYVISVDLGSVRLTERHLGAQPADPDDVAAAVAAADAALAVVSPPAVPGAVVGVAGTFTALAAITLDLAVYDPAEVHGTVVTRRQFQDLVDRLAGMTLREIEAIPSMDPARAPVMLGGAIVVERALAAIGAADVTVSEADILDGVAMSAAQRR